MNVVRLVRAMPDDISVRYISQAQGSADSRVSAAAGRRRYTVPAIMASPGMADTAGRRRWARARSPRPRGARGKAHPWARRERLRTPSGPRSGPWLSRAEGCMLQGASSCRPAKQSMLSWPQAKKISCDAVDLVPLSPKSGLIFASPLG